MSSKKKNPKDAVSITFSTHATEKAKAKDMGAGSALTPKEAMLAQAAESASAIQAANEQWKKNKAAKETQDMAPINTDAIQAWGLDKNLSIVTTAADFYMLEYITSLPTFSGAPNRESILARQRILVDTTVKQFAAYTDMAIGGEARHARNRTSIMKNGAKPLVASLTDSANTFKMSSNRHQAWLGWRTFRMRHGVMALRWLVHLFRLPGWPSGIGGQKWGRIANTLLLYETGKMPAKVFVDTCFSLHHNGGSYFNKLWQAMDMQLLDAADLGQYEYVLSKASSDVSDWYALSKYWTANVAVAAKALEHVHLMSETTRRYYGGREGD